MRHVATGQITLLDSNDYLSTGLTAPSNPVAGITLWVDTSVTPNQLKKWNGKVWEIVSDAQAAIEKAKQDAINDAAGKYVVNSTFKSNVTQLSDRIDTKVSQTDFNALGTRVGSAESKITQQSALISAKAEKTDLNALSTRVSSAEAKITSDAINLTVKSQITTAVNDVQVGGRNYAIGTSNAWSTEYVLSNGKNQVMTNFCTKVGLIGFNENDSLTISFDYEYNDFNKSEGALVSLQGSGNVTAWNSGSFPGKSMISLLDFTAKSGLIHVSYTVVLNANHIKNEFWSVGIRHDCITGRARVRNFKVERGNKATDWTPAPEDVDAAIALRPTTSEIKAGISITTGGISIFGQTLSFAGKVTFSSLDSSTQSTINGKATTGYVDSAKSSAISTAASDATTKANTALANAKSYSDTLKNSLGGLAYLSAVSLAKLDSTIVEGGYIKTSLIDADTIMTTSLLATKIAATDITTGRLTVTDGAKIGPFIVSSGRASLTATSGSDSMLLSSNLIRFIGSNSNVFIGGDTFPGTMGGALLCPQRTVVTRSITSFGYGNVGHYLSVEGASSYDDTNAQYTGNHALYIPKGDICGFRLRIRTVSSSQTLSVMDSIIISVSDSEISLTLPASPEKGQMYFIRKNGGGRVWINGSYIINDGDWYRERSTSVQLNRGGLGILMYNGTYWTWNNTNG